MVLLNGNGLQLETFIRVARFHEQVQIAEEQQQLVQKANDFVKYVVESEQPVYGINTGFGKLSDVPINKHDTAKLQENLLKNCIHKKFHNSRWLGKQTKIGPLL